MHFHVIPKPKANENYILKDATSACWLLEYALLEHQLRCPMPMYADITNLPLFSVVGFVRLQLAAADSLQDVGTTVVQSSSCTQVRMLIVVSTKSSHCHLRDLVTVK